MIKNKIISILSFAIISFSIIQAENLPEMDIQVNATPSLTEIVQTPECSTSTMQETTPINSMQTRLYYGALGTSQIAAGCFIIGGLGLSVYTLSSAVAATYAWLYTPAGTTACIGYVAETQGVSVVMPLIYGLTIKSTQVPTEAVILAGSVFAKSEGLKIAGYTGALAISANKTMQYITSTVSSFFYNGWSNLKKSFR